MNPDTSNSHTVVHLISGPRNISTALMYSFAQRPGCRVIDEPFYARYLELTGIDHPGRDKILQHESTHVDDIIERIESRPEAYSETFVKNMGQHLIQMDLDFLMSYTNAFLIRHPKKLISSFAEVIPRPTLSDIGIKRQVEIFEVIHERTGRMPVVLDSDEVLKDPRSTLTEFCERLGVSFEPAMLSWPPGEIHDPVPWAEYWYSGVLKSTGFQPPRSKDRELPERCRAVYREAMPYYETLKQHAIKA